MFSCEISATYQLSRTQLVAFRDGTSSSTRFKMLSVDPKNGYPGDENGLGNKSVSLLLRALATSLVKTRVFLT